MAVLSTLVFCALCVLAAWLVWLHRPTSRAGLTDPGFWFVMILPACAFLLFWMGSYAGHGRQVSLTVQELRIPMSDAKTDGVYFVAGPRREASDLVIGPYADAQQSQDRYRKAFDRLLTIRRKNGQWQYCGKHVAADGDGNLPGMGVRIESGPINGCKPLTSETVVASIERLDVDGKTQTRRSLSLTQRSNHISIGLPPGEQLTRHIGQCDGARAQDKLRLAPAGLHDPDRGYRIPENLVFDQLGQGGENPLLKPSVLGPIKSLASLCGTGPQQLSWPDSEPDARVIMASRTTALAWWIVGLLFFSSFWTWFTSREYWRDGAGRVEAAVVLTLQWLLALRLIIAMAGLFNNDGLRQASVLWAPAIAIVATPMLAAAMLRGGERAATRSISALLLQLPFASLLIFHGLDWQMPGAQEIILTGLAAALLIWRRWSNLSEPLLVIWLQQARWIAEWLFRVAQRLSKIVQKNWGERNAAIGLLPVLFVLSAAIYAIVSTAMPWLPLFKQAALNVPILGTVRAVIVHVPAMAVGAAVIFFCVWQLAKQEFDIWTAGLAIIFGLTVMRALLILLGIKERFSGIPLLENFPLSMVYIPPLIVGLALLITGFRAVPSLTRALWLVTAFGASFILVGFFASDFGMIWIFAWPAGWAIAALCWVKPLDAGFKSGLVRLALIGPLLSPILLAGIYYGWNIRTVPPPQTDLIGHVEAAAEWNRTAARLQRYLDPDPLIDAGSSAAFEMLEQAAQLEPLTANLWGQGYLAPSGIVVPLLTYQYSDNVLAVHIIWPFGRLGIAVFLGSLLFILAQFWRARGDGGAGEGWRGEASRLAAMIFFWSAAYMTLANLNLMPFTGRNAYFMASQSMGDLAEGFILLLLIVLPLLAAPSSKSTEAQG
jgi:hypothetical protein